MASVNKVILIGHLGRDPEVRYTASGSAVATVSIATTRQWKDKSGEKKEETEWHRVTFYERLAEIAGEYMKKGRPVYIEGRLKYGKYTDKDGVERYTTDVIATEIQLLGGRDDAGKPGQPSAERAGSSAAARAGRAPAARAAADASSSAGGGGGADGSADDLDDDIPFATSLPEADPLGHKMRRRMARYGFSISGGQF